MDPSRQSIRNCRYRCQNEHQQFQSEITKVQHISRTHILNAATTSFLPQFVDHHRLTVAQDQQPPKEFVVPL